MTLENTATTAGVVPSIVSDNEKLFPEVLNLVRATPGGVPGLLKMFQDKGLGHVAAALTSRDGTRMISPQQIVHGLRSEEHTSELQSPCNLVCRLLLEKKKI